MTTIEDKTISPLGESFGDIKDIHNVIAFGKWIVGRLDDIFTHDPIFLENENFIKLYRDSKIIFTESLDYYKRLTEEPDNSIHAKQLIDLLYNLHQAGLTKEVGTVKRGWLKEFWESIKDLTKVPIKKVLELLELINIYLGSLVKALQSAEALDEAKKYGEHILTTIDTDLEKEIQIKNNSFDKKKGGSFNL